MSNNENSTDNNFESNENNGRKSASSNKSDTSQKNQKHASDSSSSDEQDNETKRTFPIFLRKLKKPLEDPQDFSKDLECWMANLPQEIRDMPIIKLAIPGSHNSMTYTISEDRDLLPEALEWMSHFSWLGASYKSFVTDWTCTQNATITDQLMNGIRYFDFEIAYRHKEPVGFFFIHGLYCKHTVEEAIPMFMSFLTKHKQEVIILDFRHFYEMSSNEHQRLANIITHDFWFTLVPYSDINWNRLSLNYMTNKKKQVIVIYRATIPNCQFWPSNCFISPRPDVTSATKIIQFIRRGIETRSTFKGYVSRCYFSPNTAFLYTHLSSNRQDVVIALMNPKLVASLKTGMYSVNVAVADFVNIDDWAFCHAVINQNYRLITSGGRANYYMNTLTTTVFHTKSD